VHELQSHRYVAWSVSTQAWTQSPGQDSREGGIGCNPTSLGQPGCEIGAGFSLWPVLKFQSTQSRLSRHV